jgi:hypothetical protein
MRLSGIFFTSKLFFESLIDCFHIKFFIPKLFFTSNDTRAIKLMFKWLKSLKADRLDKLPIGQDTVNKFEIKKPKLTLNMDESESSNTKNKDSSTKDNRNTKNKQDKDNSTTNTKKVISNKKFNKSLALPTITDDFSDTQVWEAAAERRQLFKTFYNFYKFYVLDLGYDSDLNKERKINPRTDFYKKAFIPHHNEWQSIMRCIESKPMVDERVNEIKLTKRIDSAISKLPNRIVPKVRKVGTVFVVDENTFDETTLRERKK